MDNFKKLKNLKRLLDKDIISEEGFKTEKQKLLNEPTETQSIPQTSHTTPLKTNTGTAKLRKTILYIVICVLSIFTIIFIATNGFRKSVQINGPASSLPFVHVYFDDEEVFPVHMMYLKNTKQGLMELTITNPGSESKKLIVSYGFIEFGALESQIVTVTGSTVLKMRITPFSGKMMQQLSATNATLQVNVTDEQSRAIFSKSWIIKVNAGDEIPWKIKNQDLSKLLVSWVTPNNKSVEAIIRKAKEKIGGNFIPVEKMNDTEFRDYVKAIFNAVREEKITYTNSTVSFAEGYSQRVRLPVQTIKTKSANSLNGSVLLASLFEQAGLRPYIILLPEHAFVGVSRPNLTTNILYIETTLLGRSPLESLISFETTFSAAIKSGKEEYNNAYSKSIKNESGLFTVIDVCNIRKEGIKPIN